MSKKSILIVEDEFRIREIIVSFLSQEGLEVLEAANVDEALKILSSSKVDICVTDYRMEVLGGRTGMDLINIINDKYPNIVSILISGTVTKEDIEAKYEPVYSEFISKPFRMSAFFKVLEAYL